MMKYRKLFLLAALFLGLQGAMAVSYDFESDMTGWAGRGDAKVELSSDQAHGGSKSLYVSNRAQSWHGALWQSDYVEAGKAYKFSVYVFTKENGTIDLSVQYSLDGVANYPSVVSKECYAYSWTQLSGEIIIPEDATDIQPYIQCGSNGTLSYYLDDFTCEEKPEELVDFSKQLPLKDLFAKYFKIGTAVTASEITPKNAKNMVLHHFNSVTPGNELKPDNLLDQEACISMGDNVNPQVHLPSNAKTVLKFCSDNKIPIRGHVFVWHSQTPDWFFNENFQSNGKTVSKEVMLQRMENYIKNVVSLITTAYPDLQIYAWDIVNEVFKNDSGSLRDPGSNYQNEGTSRWMEIFGNSEFIEKAFMIARNVVPAGCKIYYNDYNEYIGSKLDGIYDLVKSLYDKGLCDGIGMQSHLSTRFPSVPLYRSALEKYATIGCDIQITELDITLEDGATFETQAQMYKELFDLYKEYHEKISLVAVWGINDEISWRAYGKPLLFSNYEPKPAYDKITEGMESELTGVVTIAIPVEKLVYIKGDNLVISTEGVYRVLSAVGQVVLKGKSAGMTEVQFNVPAGIYMVEVNGKAFKVVKR